MHNTQLISFVLGLFLVTTFEYALEHSDEEREDDTLKSTSQENNGSTAFNQSVIETSTVDDVIHRKELVVTLSLNLNGCRRNRLGRKRFSQMNKKTKPKATRKTKNRRHKKNKRRKPGKNKPRKSGRKLDFKLKETRKSKAGNRSSKAASATGASLANNHLIKTRPIIARANPADVHDDEDDDDYFYYYYNYGEEADESPESEEPDIENPCSPYLLTEIVPTVDTNFITKSVEYTTVTIINKLSTAESLNNSTETEQELENQPSTTFPTPITSEPTTTDELSPDKTTEDLTIILEINNQHSTFPASTSEATTLDELSQVGLKDETTSREERKNEHSLNESQDKTEASTSTTVDESDHEITMAPMTFVLGGSKK